MNESIPYFFLNVLRRRLSCLAKYCILSINARAVFTLRCSTSLLDRAEEKIDNLTQICHPKPVVHCVKNRVLSKTKGKETMLEPI